MKPTTLTVTGAGGTPVASIEFPATVWNEIRRLAKAKHLTIEQLIMLAVDDGFDWRVPRAR